jgi:hypothetical protein
VLGLPDNTSTYSLKPQKLVDKRRINKRRSCNVKMSVKKNMHSLFPDMDQKA